MSTSGTDETPKTMAQGVDEEAKVVAANPSTPTTTIEAPGINTPPPASALASAASEDSLGVPESVHLSSKAPLDTVATSKADAGLADVEPPSLDLKEPDNPTPDHTMASSMQANESLNRSITAEGGLAASIPITEDSSPASTSANAAPSSSKPATSSSSSPAEPGERETKRPDPVDDVSVALSGLNFPKVEEPQSSTDARADDPEPKALTPGDAVSSVTPSSDGEGEVTTAAIAAVEESHRPQTTQVSPQDSLSQPKTAEGTSNDLASPPVPRKETALPTPPTLDSGSTRASSADSPLVPLKRDSSQERIIVAKAFGVEAGAAPSSSTQSMPGKLTPAAPATPAKGESLQARTPFSAGLKVGKGPPPTTNPQEEKPFDFNHFLDQMKDPSARGVGEYVRSFIKGFAKKPYRTSDQIKLIFDFLEFISIKMRQCSVWANLSETDFDNATEAMEKLVMNRLYGFTFTPAVAKEGKWTPQTDDLEKDRVLKERIELFDWVKEEHLDVPTGEHSKGFIDFAIQELLKINHYKAPRDKLICILNCCKVIFGLIRHLSSEENADTFIPILILVVLKGNPEHLISNVEYIGRFRNPAKLSSEAGYYLSSLMGATAFIETMDYSTLSNITQEEFEKNVELAVQRIGSQSRPETVPSSGTLAPAPRVAHSRTVSTSDPHAPLTDGEEAARTLPGSASQGPNLAEDTKAFFQRTGEAARVGFTNSVGRPIGALGKLFGEGLDGIRTPTYPSASAPGSAGAQSPHRADSPSPSLSPGVKKSVFSGFFGADQHSQQGQQQQSQPQGRSVSGFNPASWSRSFRPGQDDEEPQTPSTTEARQGPFSSLIRNPNYTDAHPPLRKIGQAPDAPKARKAIPQRAESIDPFDYPDLGSTSTGGGEGSSSGDIGTPSDGSDEEGEADESALQRARRKLPDLGAFVPFLAADSPNSTPIRPPPHQQRHSGLPQYTHPQQQPHSQELTRGPGQARPAYPGDSSFLQPSSDRLTDQESEPNLVDLSADVERVHEEQMEAGVETLANVFPDTEEEVRRMVLEACNGDVGQAIDRLLEMA